ncbi:GNAT family N-acetyltransferase [Dokdonia sinensis]|nr:GNAT family N-acetyltransferase [Dokdonia sinensis]
MEYHKDRFEDASQLIFKGKNLVAILPANQVDNTIHSHQGLTYGGLLLSNKSKLTEIIPFFKEILITLKAKGITSLIIKQLPIFYASLPSQELDYLAFLCNAKTTRVDVASVIDNKNRIAIQSNRKEGVKKGARAGLTIVQTKDFSEFWKNILEPNLTERHGAKPTHTLAEITRLQERFPENIKQFNVLKDGAIAGGATIFETGITAHVQYISAGEHKQEWGTLDFLFEHLIETVFAHKRYFDFGISNENDGRNLNKGLNYWKECFGARTFVHSVYAFDTSSHSLLDDVLL